MRDYLMPAQQRILSNDEQCRAKDRLSKRNRDDLYNLEDHYDLLEGLDIGDKYNVLLRHSAMLPPDVASYLKHLKTQFEKSIPIRNDTMHGRPLTVEDYTFSFAFTEQLIRRSDLWGNLCKVVSSYRTNPENLIAKGIEFFEEDVPSDTAS
jgi:LuxR family glucitol operon transcriptional activator